MKKVIVHGNMKNTMTCSCCHCIYEYEICEEDVRPYMAFDPFNEDIKVKRHQYFLGEAKSIGYGYVKCPECDLENAITIPKWLEVTKE